MKIAEQHTEQDWIGRWALYAPESTALQDADTGEIITYAELYRQVKRMAGQLHHEYGVESGDRIAVLALNRVEYVTLFFAIRYLGAILLPLNYRLAAPEIAFQLDNAQAKLVICEQEFAVKVTDDSNDRIRLDMDDFLQRASAGDEIDTTHVSAQDLACMILYTSGTTGRPKGAVITNSMLFWNSVNTGLRLDLTKKEVILTFAPLFHTGGWNVLTTPVLHRGGKVIMMKKFEPAQILDLAEAEQVSILFGVPTMMAMLEEEPRFSKADLNSIRYAIVGGEPMPIPLIEKWQEKGIPIRQGYGLTEFGPNVFSLNEEDAIRKKGSIGFPNFYIEAGIFDDQGVLLGDEQTGELWLRGPVCMDRYWNNEEATQEACENGWLKTGDMARRDSEGYYYIVDRKKDMFISGAENVYPAEVEHVIRTHPDVKEVAVIGVEDNRWGEVGKAFVVSHSGSLTTEDLTDFCRERLARYKVPKHWAFPGALPKSDTGKIQKRDLHSIKE